MMPPAGSCAVSDDAELVIERNACAGVLVESDHRVTSQTLTTH
jgi:hypothetical protein